MTFVWSEHPTTRDLETNDTLTRVTADGTGVLVRITEDAWDALPVGLPKCKPVVEDMIQEHCRTTNGAVPTEVRVMEDDLK